MKILYISGSYPPIKCGVGDYLEKLTWNLDKSIDWRVITSKSASASSNIKNIVTSWRKKDYKGVKKQIVDFEPDIIHLQYPSVCYGRKPFINFLPYKLKKDFPNIKKIITIHEYHDASFLGKRRILLTIKPFENIIVSNIEDKKDLQKKFASKNYQLIPIGSNIDILSFDNSQLEKVKQKFNPQNKKIILNLGFVDPSKGLEKLIQSAKNWPSDIRLIIATSFDRNNLYHIKLLKIVKSTNADIYWTGYLDTRELSALMQIAYVAILPFEEPISLRRGSLVATITHNLPVITTGPSEELLVDRKNCLLLESNGSKQITEKLNTLLADKKLYKLIKVNLSKVSKEFEWSLIAKKHRQIYTKLTKKN